MVVEKVARMERLGASVLDAVNQLKVLLKPAHQFWMVVLWR